MLLIFLCILKLLFFFCFLQLNKQNRYLFCISVVSFNFCYVQGNSNSNDHKRFFSSFVHLRFVRTFFVCEHSITSLCTFSEWIYFLTSLILLILFKSIYFLRTAICVNKEISIWMFLFFDSKWPFNVILLLFRTCFFVQKKLFECSWKRLHRRLCCIVGINEIIAQWTIRKVHIMFCE